MLTAEGIIGKLVSFIADKSIGKLLDLPFDKRRKACRSLTKLYYCIQALDEVTERFEQTLNDFQESGDAEAMVHALNNNSYGIELATNMFIDLGSELYAGLEIVDPVLAKCCHLLYVSKFDFLSFLSNFVHWERDGDKSRLVIRKPQGIMEAVDLDDLYETTKRGMQSDDKFYWPSSALDDFSTDFKEISITFEDDKTAVEVRDMIRQQNSMLKAAKERLRVLIKESFSIEEVLFQSDSQPYRSWL